MASTTSPLPSRRTSSTTPARARESETPLKDSFDIGVFTAEPGQGKFNSADVVSMGRQAIHTGTQTVTLTVSKKPVYVGVDPYNKWIDRDSNDKRDQGRGVAFPLSP